MEEKVEKWDGREGREVRWKRSEMVVKWDSKEVRWKRR